MPPCIADCVHTMPNWRFDGGAALPERKDFTQKSFNASTRTFTGTVDWMLPGVTGVAPGTMAGAAQWRKAEGGGYQACMDGPLVCCLLCGLGPHPHQRLSVEVAIVQAILPFCRPAILPLPPPAPDLECSAHPSPPMRLVHGRIRRLHDGV